MIYSQYILNTFLIFQTYIEIGILILITIELGTLKEQRNYTLALAHYLKIEILLEWLLYSTQYEIYIRITYSYLLPLEIPLTIHKLLSYMQLKMV